jgi:prepilin-type N-terminal cleavage/methylation domain-containing protein
MKKNNQGGYTLVEISIVLAIIGLLIGSVIKGQELIQSTKDKKVITEWTSTKSAISTFKGKYGAMPGDYGKATDLIDPSAKNGNHNGIIEINNYRINPRNQEVVNSWKHLSLADLIVIPHEQNIPGRFQSSLDGADWWMTTDTMRTSADGYARDNRHYMHLMQTLGPDISSGTARSDSYNLNRTNHRNAIKKTRATIFDEKFDDSNADTGEIRMRCGNSSQCRDDKKCCQMQFYIGG